MKRTDKEIRKLLEQTAKAAEHDISRLTGIKAGQVVRRGQLQLARRSLKRRLADMWRGVGDLIRAGKADAVEKILKSAFNWEAGLFRQAGVSAQERQQLRKGLVAMSERNVERMLRRFGTTQIPLSKQVYKTQALSNGWVDNLINKAIGRGLTAKELAAEVRNFIRPDVRGGVSYAAMRLARTEINNASHAAAIAQNADRPWVLGARWHLSGSHPKPDICDELANKDSFDMGDGIYPKGHIPDKPHPHCLCFITPVLQDEDDFVKDLAAGRYDSFIESAA